MPLTDYADVLQELFAQEGARLKPAMDGITKLRNLSGNEHWPAWCYIGRAHATTVVELLKDQIPDRQGADVGPHEEELWYDGELAATLSSWRLTKGIYAFDPDLYRALTSTPLTDEIPTELFYRLPEWCVYIPIPEELRDDGDDTISLYRREGFFARLNYGNVDYAHATDHDSHAIIISHVQRHRKTGELVLSSYDASIKHSNLTEGIAHYYPEVQEDEPDREAEMERIVEFARGDAEAFAPYLNLILYLCSEMPEIEGKGQPGNPKRVKTKKGWREFAASGTRLWNVGARIGATIRKENTGTRTEERDPVTGRAKPRPHIRRAHWNTYWTGPKTAPQTPVLRWIPPTLVANDPNTAEELPTTIRPVKQ